MNASSPPPSPNIARATVAREVMKWISRQFRFTNFTFHRSFVLFDRPRLRHLQIWERRAWWSSFDAKKSWVRAMSDPDPAPGVSPNSDTATDATAGRYNQRNPAVKRILREMREMGSDDSLAYHAEAVESDIFEWHFAILGAENTEFEGGIYHGRVLLPPEYPFKPPSFVLLTHSGRFVVNEKICLSITQHHPEHWQPSWSVRTALTAVRAFMPTASEGAVGSLEYTKEEREVLARKSRAAPPAFGASDERREILQRVHQAMLRKWETTQKDVRNEEETESTIAQKWETSRKTMRIEGGTESGSAESASAESASAESASASASAESASAALNENAADREREGRRESCGATEISPPGESLGATELSQYVPFQTELIEHDVPSKRSEYKTEVCETKETENEKAEASASASEKIAEDNSASPANAPAPRVGVSSDELSTQEMRLDDVPTAPSAVPSPPTRMGNQSQSSRRTRDTPEVAKLKQKLDVAALVLLVLIFSILARRILGNGHTGDDEL